MRALSALLLAAAACLLLCQTARASSGDQDPQFRACFSRCVKDDCGSATPRSSNILGILPAWPCKDECKYHCMWQTEDQRRIEGHLPRQYFGKWPFRRVLGVQEPFSSLFSLMNAIPHIAEIVLRRDKLAPRSMDRALRFLSLLSCIIAINTWFWSTAFHARDMWWTERLDYHFATLHMIFYLWYAIVRFSISTLPKRSVEVTTASGSVLGVLFLYHVWYMNFVSFDYSYNMLVTGLFFGLQVAVWLLWAVLVFLGSPIISGVDRTAKSKECAMMVVKFQLSLLTFALFETFDFPPILDLLDAHAIWHGLTIGLGFYWYRFRELDARLLIAKKDGI